jgi:hypothetical protein
MLRRSLDALQPLIVPTRTVPERNLWSSVLLQAIDDLQSGTRVEYVRIKDWIGTRDFVWVCRLAGICPRRTEEELMRIAGLRQPRKANGYRCRPVVCLETGQRWESITECADYLSAEPQHLRRAMKLGRRIRGYRFKALKRRRK